MLFIIISTIILTILSLLSLNWFNLETSDHFDILDTVVYLTRIIPILLIINIYYNYNSKNKFYILYSLIAGYILYSLIPFLSCYHEGTGLIYIPNIINNT